jgi:protein O-GlcNAc transferase
MTKRAPARALHGACVIVLRARDAVLRYMINLLQTASPAEIYATKGEWKFECEKGLVCGVGSSPPMHSFSFDLSPLEVRRASESLAVHQVASLNASTASRVGACVSSPVSFLQRDDASLRFGYADWIVPPSPAAHYTSHVTFDSASNRLVVGLVSGDLIRNHAVGNVMMAALRYHDYSRIHVVLFATTPQTVYYATKDETTRRLAGAAKVVDIFEMSAADAADVINTLSVHILVDMSGYTTDHRQHIFITRPAPLQLHYHGYVGTIGASYIDYYVGDRIISPPEHAAGFSEKLALHSLSFLGPSHRHIHLRHGLASASDLVKRDRVTSQRVNELDSLDASSQRSIWGVHSSGRLVCFFNQHFKIDPATFAMWSRVFKRFNDTVFWLLEGNVASERHLTREWAAAGLSPSRLVFANRTEPNEHILRASLCDLAVDTPMYNSGATAADTLFAGVPIVTRPSSKLAGRMAASMLRGVGMGKLTVARNEEDNEALLMKVTCDV